MIDERIIRENLDKILSRREFRQTPSENPIANAIDRFIEATWEWIKKLFQRYNPDLDMSFNTEFSNELTNVLKFLLIAFGVVFVFFIVRLIVTRVYLPARMKKRGLPDVNNYIDRPDEVFEKIKSFVSQKEYTKALCFLFVAVLIELNRKTIIKVEKWKTNRIYIMEVRRNAGEYLAPMQEFNAVFNRCCYGGRKADEMVVNTWYEFFMKLREN
jgi:hypothetical protein